MCDGNKLFLTDLCEEKLKKKKKMSQKAQMLRSLVEQRLTEAAAEIFGLFERAMVEHEEEFCRTKEENQRLRQMLDEVLNPRAPKTVSHSDIQVVKVVKEETPDWGPIVIPECPLPLRFKEEEREMSITPEQFHMPERAVTNQIIIGENTVDGGAMTQVSQFHHLQPVENQMETSEDDCGGSDPDYLSETENTDNSSDSEDNRKAQKQKRRHQSFIHPQMVPAASSFYEGVKAKANGEDFGNPKPGSSVKQEVETDSDEKTENSSDSDCHTDDPKKGKRHQCSECNKVFSTGQILRKHKKTSASGVHSSDPNPDVHKKSQTGGKWYSCPICQKTFSHKFDFKKHLKAHKRQKPSTGQKPDQAPK